MRRGADARREGGRPAASPPSGPIAAAPAGPGRPAADLASKSGWAAGAGAVLASLVVHGLIATVAIVLLPALDRPPDNPVVQIELVEPPPPPPPPVPEPPPPPEAPPEPPPPPRAVPQIRPKVAQIKPPAPRPAVPPPPTPQPPSPLPPAGGFSLDMEATTKGGGVGVVATDDGGNMMADPNRHDLAPGRPGPPPPPPPPPVLHAAEVDRLPGCPTLQPEYPVLARRLEQEADVVLRLQIGADGRVARAEVKRPGGEGFDEAALGAARAMRCKPARRGGEAVAVWIDYEISFRLVD